MDARIDVYALLGIGIGDAHIIRNAGGLVTDDALRSLSASQRLLGTEEIVLVMHRGCGLEGADDEEFAESLTDDGCPHPAWRLGGFEDLEQTLRDGLDRLRTSPELIARDRVRGLIYNPEDGAVQEIS
jgi:carbonic anhydrase